MNTRFIVVLVALVAVASAMLTCPTDTTNLYNIPTTECPRVDTCLDSFCTCIGGTYANRTHSCEELKHVTDCAKLATCTASVVKCFNEEAELAMAASTTANNNEGCTEWASPIYNALLEAAATTPGNWTKTTLYGACTFEACQFANATTSCQADYATTCVAPPRYFGTLRITGDWVAILAVPNQKANIINAAQADLQAELKTTVNVAEVRAGSLIVDFTLNDYNEDIQAAIAKAGNSSAWLTNTDTAFKTYGGQGDLTVISMGETVTEAPSTPAPEGKSSSCSTGCVAGIIIGVVVAVCLVAAVLFTRSKKGDEDSELTQGYGGTKYNSV